MAFEHILFDLDGTLTDSYEGIAKCVQYALHYYGIEENNEENIEKPEKKSAKKKTTTETKKSTTKGTKTKEENKTRKIICWNRLSSNRHVSVWHHWQIW